LVYWGLNSGSVPWAIPPALFCVGYFRDRISTICLGWLQTLILLISASWVARITGVSYRCSAVTEFLCIIPNYESRQVLYSWLPNKIIFLNHISSLSLQKS
jgi:hypothetical protein